MTPLPLASDDPVSARPHPNRLSRWMLAHPHRMVVLVFVLYAVCSLVYWGLPLWGHWTTRVVGSGTDPLDIFVWDMAWWPYAITHGHNPFVIHGVWTPVAANAGWRTAVPALSILAMPLTLDAGPVASYNVLMLLGPALTATATYLLIAEVTEPGWVAVWAGYIVGFSSYEVSQTLGHLHLTFAAMVPLALWLAVRLYRSRRGRPWLVAGLAAVLVVQFLISTEVFLTLAGFGGLALGMAALLVDTARPQLKRLALSVGAAYVVALLVLSPWLVTMFSAVGLQHVNNSVYATNLLNFILPTRTTLGGQWLSTVTFNFSHSDMAEASGYLGVPLLVLVIVAIVRLRREAAARAAAYVLVIVVLLTLGPSLRVGSWKGPLLPWAALSRLPLLGVVVPGRFMLYVAILAAGLVSVYAARVGAGRRRRWLGVCMVAAACFLVPNLRAPFWSTSAQVPRLIASPRLLARYVPKGDTVLVLPYFNQGEGTFLQAESHFDFRLADGYLAPTTPSPWSQVQLVYLLSQGITPTNSYAVAQFRLLMQMGGVDEVMASLPVTPSEQVLLGRSGLAPQGEVGGMALWHVPAALSRPLPLAQMTRVAFQSRWTVETQDATVVVRAAERYLAAGRPLDDLSLDRLEQLGLLGADQLSFGINVPGWHATAWDVALRPWGSRTFAVALATAPGQTVRLPPRLTAQATRVYFPYPTVYHGKAATGTALLVFQR